MRILIISQEVWRDDQNGGNVLSNIFKHIKKIIGKQEPVEFAQIYCSEGTPQNLLCQNYYQMTDKMILTNVLKRKTIVGRKFMKDCSSVDANLPIKDNFHMFKKLRFESFLVAKEILWKMADWKNASLKKFVDDFNPDIIFAPCYGWHYMLKLTRVVKEWTKKPVISYISDDFYSCKQFRFSPVYWVNHLILRKNIRKTFSVYDLVYTMTEAQKQQCETSFGANMKILRKSANFTSVPIKTSVGSPIKLVYAGNLYLNRWRTLKMLVKQIRKVNSSGVKMRLDIYTNSILDKRQSKYLNDGIHSSIHNAVTYDELVYIYNNSDIALHVEGFDLKSRLTVRLSFSTKIIDCLASGCATMAICDKSQSGFSYLKNNDVALCCDKPWIIKGTLDNIIETPKILCDVQNKAVEFGMLNHDEFTIVDELCSDFIEVKQKYCHKQC